ncbi:MAG TPA: hypothetical protein V6C81_21100 [Planktothrix sp.]|jgi:hypothetical protein
MLHQRFSSILSQSKAVALALSLVALSSCMSVSAEETLSSQTAADEMQTMTGAQGAQDYKQTTQTLQTAQVIKRTPTQFTPDLTRTTKPAFPVAGKVSRTIQSVTGLNLLAGVVASTVAKHELRRKLGSGQINVKIRTFSLTDLCAGKVKSVDVKLARCLVKTFPLGNVKISSCEPIWFDPGLHGHKAGLQRPIQFVIAAKLNREQIAQALNNPKVVSSIRGLKLDLPGLGAQQLQILHPNVSLSENALVVDCLLVTKGAPEDSGVHVSISGRPSIEGAKIYLRDLQVASADIPNPEEFSKFMDELFNPILDMGRYDRTTHAFRLVAIKIDPATIRGDGTLVLAPKPGVQLAQAPSAKPKNLFRSLF